VEEFCMNHMLIRKAKTKPNNKNSLMSYLTGG
jgi:hypothetical protein